MCSEHKVTGQCMIEHYLSSTKVKVEFVWSIQTPEGEQDNSATEPFAHMDFEAIQRQILRQRRLF